MTRKTLPAPWSGRLVPAALIWLLITCLLPLQLWPDVPRTGQQWALFLAFGPPLYVLGEALCSRVFTPAHGRAISRKRFSVARVAVALPVVLAWFALSWWIASLIGS